MSETNIHIHAGSIFDVQADAIVNPANSFLNHSGGLARVLAQRAACAFTPLVARCVAALHADRAAHKERVLAWIVDNENAPLIATGNAYHTSPGALPFKGVIHAVGPIWNGGHFYEPDLLEMAHASVLDVGQAHGYTSVVFPAISCGVFGFPVERAAAIAVEVGAWGIDYGVKDVTFALTSDEHVAAFRAALSGLRP